MAQLLSRNRHDSYTFILIHSSCTYTFKEQRYVTCQRSYSEGAMARVDIRKGAREKWKRKHILSCRLRKLNNAFIVGWDKWDGNSYHKQLQQSDFHKQKRSISSSLKIHYPIAWVMRRVRNWWSKRHTTRIWTAKRLVNRHQGRWVGRKRRQSLWRMCFAIS